MGLLVRIAPDGGPSIVYWGKSLGSLSEKAARVLVLADPFTPSPSGDEPRARVAIVPEHHFGWTGQPGLTGSRDGRAWSPKFECISAFYNGEPTSGYVEAGAGTIVFEGADVEIGLSLRVEVELLDSGLIRARSTVGNLDEEPYSLDGLFVTFPVPVEALELMDFTGRWGRERSPQRAPFSIGTHSRDARGGRPGHDSAFLLHAGTPDFGFGRGDVFAVHVAWSGNQRIYAEKMSWGAAVLGGGELLLPGEIRLGKNEEYASPWVYASYGLGLDGVAQRFHKHQRSRERRVNSNRPVTLNTWEAVYFDHNRETLFSLAEKAALVGVERFVLDDGWFGGRRDAQAGLGDWTVSTEVWPEGLHPLVDQVKALGMEFGLWVEPEMVNPDSDLAREHPEWVMSARTEWPSAARWQQVLDLTIEGAYEHVRGQLFDLLDEYDISYLKWDHNRELLEAGSQLKLGSPAVHGQTLAFYRLLDELRAKYPALEIETCASGGGRVDLGVLEHTDRVWVSDNSDPVDRQHMLRWAGQLVPPEYLGSHIAAARSHTTSRTHDLSFRAGTAIFGHLGVEWDLTQATESELTDLSEWIRFFKAERELLLGGNVVRMDHVQEGQYVYGVINNDASRGIFAIVDTMSVESKPGPRLRLRGLDPNRDYRICPLRIGRAPERFTPPSWFGEVSDTGWHGIVLPGPAIENVGVERPDLRPEQLILLIAEAM
ncbi:alpha-galactosidase [Microbacterium sp. Au-Mic1]|uniref:alpha-galactosidase n=1 Tax=Microbacterium sp. Au-Mic1 TaxID=2906457 RepID=UPI001E54E3DE|nr:alpha-galactosidase [Microbacterium sp. Au-Mic1]MCE4026250.1 alpha-galactosidase [Microbacterium sp. Au-Mic1]